MELSKLKLPELKALCKQRGIAQYSKCNKQQLIDKLAAVGVDGDTGNKTPEGLVLTSTGDTTKSVLIAPESGHAPTRHQASSAIPHQGTKSISVTNLAVDVKGRASSGSTGSDEGGGSGNNKCGSNGSVYSDASQQIPVIGNTNKKKESAPKKASKKSSSIKKANRTVPSPSSTSTSTTTNALAPRQDAIGHSAEQIASTATTNSMSDPTEPSFHGPAAAVHQSSNAAYPSNTSNTSGAQNGHAFPGKHQMPSAASMRLSTAKTKPSTAVPLTLNPTSQRNIASPLSSTNPPSSAPSRSSVSLKTNAHLPTPILPVQTSVARPTIPPTPTLKPTPKRPSAFPIKPKPIKRARIQLLPMFRPAPTKVPVPLPAPPSDDYDTPNDPYIRSHFLYIAYAHLDAAREKPTNRQLPCFERIMHLPIPAFRVAVRFVVARLHTLLQLGTVDFDLIWGYVVMECNLVSGDVWRMKIKFGQDRRLADDDGKEEEYHVIGATGEPIPPARADWATYLSSPTPQRWLDYVKTKDDTAFVKGKGMDEGLAERVVLANCALNSFSGDKLSALQMDSEHLGQPALHKSANLELYLPESHQLLSLHPTAHPAILTTHLRLGTYYVLKDTGQMIGDEEGEGVVELWQGILGCTPKGEVDEGVAKRFWAGWEGRVRDMFEQRFE